jgi:hypothetical protein
MHQVMWARWIEITREHEQRANSAYTAICAGDTRLLVDELREGLVAFAAAASTIEALYEDTKYLIPARPKKSPAAKTITDGLATAFGLSEADRQALGRDLKYVFDRRNEALHGYCEPTPPEAHPAGLMSASEAARFNGPESSRALGVALRVLGYAEQPPKPANRWVRRWARERAAYHQQVVKPIREATQTSDEQ